MAVRGVYTDLEKQILKEFEADAATRGGWSKPAPMGFGDSPYLTIDTIKRINGGVDPWNPFFNLENYAAASRFGSIIAHPFFAERYKPPEHMVYTKKGRFLTFYLMGHDFENFQPIKPGDTLRAYGVKPTLEDSTDISGTQPHKFRYRETWCDIINQRNEVVTRFKQFVEITLHEGKPPVDPYMDMYGYTEKEINYLKEMVENEKIRGPKILYWEDVKAGDVLPAVTTGPTDFIGMNFPEPPLPPGQVKKRTMPSYNEPLQGPVMTPYVPDRDTGLIYLVHGGRHSNDRAAQYEGGPRAWIFNFVSRYPMCRQITNWMGDDGFMCKFSWRHIWRTPVGDTLIVNGRITKKYVENGEHLVDISTWCLNLRGSITDMATATVKLLSKKDKYPDTKDVINR